MYNTGFDDSQLLETMYDTWKGVQEHCADKDITEGSVSLSELEMWAQAVKADNYGNVRENCIDCVVACATSVPDEQKEIISSVIDHRLCA